jgi:hypothetical protein
MEINFLEAFFGINSGQQNRFINQFNRLRPIQNQVWGVKNAIWIDTNNAWEWFLTIPEFRAVVDKRASMMASNVPKLYDANGDEILNHWFLDMVKHPNPTQSWADVVYSLSVNDALYSNAFGYCPLRSMNQRNLFVPLPSDKIQIQTSGKTLKQMDLNGLIDSYKFRYDDGEIETLAVEDIIYLATMDGMNIVKPTSRIDALKYPLSNIKASYHKRNVLLENIGAIGILSAQNSDMGGAIPMTPEEKRTIQRDWFNRSKDEVIITESQVNWQSMSYPTRDLMLFEELNADKMAIIDAYGLNSNLFSSEKGSTFSNVQDSIRMVYTDTIIPETQQMYDAICHQLGLDKEGIYIEASFDHLPVLQRDELTENQALNSKVNTYNLLLQDGIISKEQFASELGFELQPIDKAEAQQNGLIQAQTELRGTVGGLNGIIAINTAVSLNQMSRDTAVNTLVNYYGYDRIVAESMITAVPEVITTPNTF